MTMLRLMRGGVCLLAASIVGGCSDFVTVQNPNIVEAGGINPDTADAAFTTRWRKRSAPGPSTSTSPMWETSNMPTCRRTAECSSRIPS